MDERLSDLMKRYSGPPVNIEAIIRGLGIKLDKRAQLEANTSGELRPLGSGIYEIAANASDSYLRQRFTMAHELGHFMLHRNLIGDGISDDRLYRSTDQNTYLNTTVGPEEEAAANRFAARILMPAEQVRAVAKEVNSVAELAKRFQVSKRAMEVRLSSLNLSLPDA